MVSRNRSWRLEVCSQTEERASARPRGERRLGICEGQVTAWAPGRRKRRKRRKMMMGWGEEKEEGEKEGSVMQSEL